MARATMGASPAASGQKIRKVRVDVETTSQPERVPGLRAYRCDADLRISEGDHLQITKARLTVNHPRGWMGVAAGFVYEIDSRQFPTFAARAEHACLETLKEFPSDHIISVFLLGTGDREYSH